MTTTTPRIPMLLMVGLGMLLTACSSSDGGTTPSSNGGATGTLKAPVLMEVTPMSSALHLSWTNAQPDCDSIEGERMMMGRGSYESAFSVPGSVDNKMDTSATEDMTYMYRLRCKKGGTASPYSNEMSGNPHMMDGGMGGSGMMDGGMGGSSMMMDGGGH